MKFFNDDILNEGFFLLLGVIALLILANFLAGCEGKTGPTGATGQQGSQGIIGPSGPAGQDGTIITVVQFCPNATPTYPTTFPEVALCMDGNLYAVYSANGGYLFEVVDGTYDSNAVGSACSFVVSGCTVSPE